MNLFRIPSRDDDLKAAAPPVELVDPDRPVVDRPNATTNPYLVVQSGHHETPVAPLEIKKLVGRDADLARAALEKLRSATMPEPDEAEALERIICGRRPALKVEAGRLESWRAGRSVLGDDWQPFRKVVVRAAASVGRIENRNTPIGTGFVVGDHIIATNRHVVDQLFPRPDGTLDATGIRFGLTSATGDVQPTRLTEVVRRMPAPLADLALLRADEESPCPPALGVGTDAVHRGAPVAVIGYPFADARVPAFAAANFLDNLSILTVCPGKVSKASASGDSLEHDCQTLGGNSGSPLLSVTSGKVVGVHYEGRFLQANSAVTSRALADLLASIG